ncbi:MAG: DNA polymerase III subunit gamma/tau, partial [Clostridiales bacterium]|nr:DNA polymerase III subunit gamma/tau [Clostridiales bacterium]
CGVCPTCVALKAENSMDVLEIDAASNNGVDEIRDLREKVNYPPATAKYRVYIIDEVHMLSTGAFNALLKTLEEPPRHAVFILATTEPQKLPATILSRCQRFDFKRLSADTIVERMMVVLGGIGRTATDAALSEIARAAEGAMRDALSILDVCLSYTDGEVDIELVRDALGTAGTPFLFEFADALIRYDARAAILLIDRLLRDGLDAQVFARDVAGHLRALLLAQVAGDALAGLLECTGEDANRFREQAARAERSQLFRLTELFLRAEPDMKWVGSPRALLELLAVRACHPEREEDASLGERIARVEKALASGAAPAPAKAPAPPAPAKPEPAQRAAARPAAKPAAVPEAFLKALAALAGENPSLRKALEGMRFVGFADGALVAEFPKPQLMFMKMLERRQPELERAFEGAFGQPVKLTMRLEGEAAPAATAFGAIGATGAARRAIEQGYDVFGRENIDLTD